MDYSKIGTKLYYNVKNENKNATAATTVHFTPQIVRHCDTVIINNSENVKKVFDGQPLKATVQNLNGIGALCHKFKGLYLYKSHTESPQSIQNYFKSLKINGLCDIYRNYGMDGLYTFFLNRAAAGASIDSIKKLYEKINKECETLGINTPNAETWIKDILKRSDFDYLPWKKQGFIEPKETKMPDFTDSSYKATREYYINKRINEKIPNGFRDAGHHVSFERNGKFSELCFPTREITIVDKRNDKILNETIQKLKTIFDRNPYMSYEERVKTLYTFVNELYGVKGDAIALVEEFKCIPMKLGDIIASGTGVCRHKALTAKVLADEIGLNMSLIRGRYKHSNGYQESYIWNEVYLPTGKTFVFDTSLKKLINMDSKDKFLEKYHTLAKTRMYK